MGIHVLREDMEEYLSGGHVLLEDMSYPGADQRFGEGSSYFLIRILIDHTRHH